MNNKNYFLIIGLGNIGDKYKKNRHNAGFLVLDFLIEIFEKTKTLNGHKIYSDFKFCEQKKFFGSICEISVEDLKFFFLKPSTYMNLSGKSVIALKNFYKIDQNNILVIHDEIDFESCKARFKDGGGEGGHNGLKSLSSVFGSNKYFRLRIGVGKPEKNEENNYTIPVCDYVLSDLNSEEMRFLEKLSVFLSQNIINFFISDEKQRQKVFNEISKI